MFYSHHLNKTIAEVVEQHMSLDPSEQLALFEELAIVRETAGTTMKLYNAAVETGNPEAMVAAGALVREVLKEVASVCESAARVAAIGKDKFSVHNLNYVVNRITQIAFKTFGDDEEGMKKARQFEKMIREEVKIAGEVEGTNITPDQDVLAMDGMIPKE